MLEWLKRITGTQDDESDFYCSFCGAHRSQVLALIAAPDAYICENCTLTTIGVLEAEVDNHQTIARALFAAYEATPRESVRARRAAWAAAEAWSKRNTAELRLFAWWASSQGGYACALEARHSISSIERLSEDEIAFAHLYTQIGDHDAADAALERVETEDEVQLALLRYHRVAIETGRARPCAARIRELLTQLESAQTTLGLPPYLAARRAELRLLQGDVASARRALDSSEPQGSLGGHPGYVSGCVAEAEGNDELAREAYTDVVNMTPEHVLAGAAREALLRLAPRA